MKKVVRLTENDLKRIVRKTIKESQGEPMDSQWEIQITIEDIASSIESGLSENDIDPGWYEDEIYIAAGEIMESFRYQLDYIDENVVFMDLLEDLRNRDDEEEKW
jgi:hypothetical protein